MRQIFRNQALRVAILTDLAQNVAILMSAHDGAVCTLSDHWFRLVHKVFGHKDLIISRNSRNVILVVLCKVADITSVKCNICFLWALEQHLCVLGLCLMALVLHHMMLEHAHQGLCSNWCLVPLIFSNLVARFNSPIQAWLFQLALFFAMDVTTVFLTSVCKAAYPFREQLGLPFVDVLLKACNALRLFLRSIF